MRGSAKVALPLLGLSLWLVSCIPGEVREGERLFQANCASCHGPSALGTELAPAIHPESRRQITRQVRSPAGQMPALSPEQLSDADLARIAEFLLYLHRTSHPH